MRRVPPRNGAKLLRSSWVVKTVGLIGAGVPHRLGLVADNSRGRGSLFGRERVEPLIPCREHGRLAPCRTDGSAGEGRSRREYPARRPHAVSVSRARRIPDHRRSSGR